MIHPRIAAAGCALGVITFLGSCGSESSHSSAGTAQSPGPQGGPSAGKATNISKAPPCSTVQGWVRTAFNDPVTPYSAPSDPTAKLAVCMYTDSTSGLTVTVQSTNKEDAAGLVRSTRAALEQQAADVACPASDVPSLGSPAFASGCVINNVPIATVDFVSRDGSTYFQMVASVADGTNASTPSGSSLQTASVTVAGQIRGG